MRKRQWKKILSVVLALAMVFSMNITAFADPVSDNDTVVVEPTAEEPVTEAPVESDQEVPEETETEEPVAPAEEPVAGESAPAEDVAPVEETPTAEGVAEDAAAGEEIVEEPVEKAEEAVGAVDVTSTGTITVDSNIKFTSNETATVSGLTFAGTFEGTAVSKNGIFTVTIKKGLATVKSEGALYVIDGVNPGKLSVYGEVKPENWTSTTDLQDRTSEEHRSGS